MAPTLYLVRHGQGYHNVEENGSEIHDPKLTSEGEDQCRELCKNFLHHDKIDLLLASPMHRTIQTALIGFSPAVERGLKVVTLPHAQESTDENCDTGSDHKKVDEFSDHIDTQHVFPGWEEKDGDMSSDAESVIGRAKKLRRWIKARPEQHVVLATHGKFAHFLTDDVNADGEQTSAWWDNAECRSYTFAEDEPLEGQAMLIETEESKKRRNAAKVEAEADMGKKEVGN